MICEAYRVFRWRGRPLLVCLVCDNFTTYPEDIMHYYCPFCNLFLAELPDDYRRPPRTTRNLPGWQGDPHNDPNGPRTPPEAS